MGKRYQHIILISFLLGSMGLMGQQLPQFSQYFNNPITINPAVAGSTPYMDIRFHQRMQWVGFEGAPTTSILSAHSNIGLTNGVGGYLFNDLAGPVRRTGLNLAYSYRIHLAEGVFLRLGLSGSLFQYAMNGQQIELYETGDGLIDQSVNSSTWVPDAGFGAYYQYNAFFAGFSALQLPKYKVDVFGGTDFQGYLNREHHFYFITGYTYDIDKEWQLKGTGYLNYVPNNPLQFALHGAAIFRRTFELGAAYRNADAITGHLGVHYEEWHMTYSYDLLVSELAGVANGSHEIILGYELWLGGDAKKRYNVKSSGHRKK